MNRIKIQYFSDLHLEFYKLAGPKYLLSSLKPKAEIAVVAGDLGYPFQDSYKMALRYFNKTFNHTFLIHGNHEYYTIDENKDKSPDEIKEKTHSIIKDNNLNNIHFLDNDYYDLGDYRFIGSTLWSELHDPFNLINDKNMIKDFDFNEYNHIHNKNKLYIKEMLENSQNKKIIMITHHSPSYLLGDSKYKDSVFNHCFLSNCDYLIRDPIKCWIFGHIHCQIDKMINNVRCVANPLGYPRENLQFDSDRIVEV